MKEKYKIGIVGSGFIARGLVTSLNGNGEFSVSKVLTRRNARQVADELKINSEMVTNSTSEIIDNSRSVVECSGDPIYATGVLAQVLASGLNVVTMDSELQVTTGSWLAKRGYITEAEGDQPGSLAALNEEAKLMGFTPVVYGNIKGYLNHNPTREDMDYWSKRNGISIQQVTSFTDGTKIQIEQALVANGLEATILTSGLLGIAEDELQIGAEKLAMAAENTISPVSDYLLSRKLPAGIFIVGKHHSDQMEALRYFKMGDGPYYTLFRPFHLCHLEIPKTLRRVANGGEILLNNGSSPTISVAAIAKKELHPGDKIEKAVGGFDARGTAVKAEKLKWAR